MTTPPDQPNPWGSPEQPANEQAHQPPPPGQQPPGYQQPPPGYQQQAPGYQQGDYAYNPQAPYGYDPKTGLPLSEKTKLIAGLLQILLPFGIGRFYTGHIGIAVAQLIVTIVTCGIGAIWCVIDGILLLINDSTDSDGRPLRTQ